MLVKTIFGAAALVSASAAVAAPLPDAVAAMLEAASGDAAQLKTIADIAKKTNPQSIAEIDAKVASIEASQAKAREEKLASQGILEGWSGSGEAGGFISSGNTSTKGVAIGVNVAKETRLWKHSLRGFVDYQRQDGVTTRERYFAGYEGNYNITPRFYALLTLSYESDIFAGYDTRFSESLGLGYKLVDTPKVQLGLEAGPALRQTQFTDDTSSNGIAFRGAGNFNWKITPTLEFTENAAYFYQDINSTFNSLTSLTWKLTDAFSGRFSFLYQTQTNPPPGLANYDTTTRLTLVYNF
jgi:putative salt-induced outer membrane protein